MSGDAFERAGSRREPATRSAMSHNGVKRPRKWEGGSWPRITMISTLRSSCLSDGAAGVGGESTMPACSQSNGGRDSASDCERLQYDPGLKLSLTAEPAVLT